MIGIDCHMRLLPFAFCAHPALPCALLLEVTRHTPLQASAIRICKLHRREKCLGAANESISCRLLFAGALWDEKQFKLCRCDIPQWQRISALPVLTQDFSCLWSKQRLCQVAARVSEGRNFQTATEVRLPESEHFTFIYDPVACCYNTGIKGNCSSSGTMQCTSARLSVAKALGSCNHLKNFC
jgi:hypothetical protein